MITIDELHSSIKKDRIKELMKYAEQYDMQNNEEVLEGIVFLNRLQTIMNMKYLKNSDLKDMGNSLKSKKN